MILKRKLLIPIAATSIQPLVGQPKNQIYYAGGTFYSPLFKFPPIMNYEMQLLKLYYKIIFYKK
jgi:hypothetical protein